MKRIALFRHAEAIDGPPDMADIDRPLTPRGRKDAAAMGAVICRRPPPPDVVLCSPSVRTRETVEFANLPGGHEMIVSPAIYHAPAQHILAAIKALSDTHAYVLVVGHNPGFHDLALKLANPADADAGALAQLRKKFPKGALAAFQFDIAEWRETSFGGGRLTNFTRPKELRGR